MSSTTKTVAFLGASTGVGLSALKHTLAAGHACVALARVPSRITDVLPLDKNPNLTVIQGNAHDLEVVSRLLRKDATSTVDAIITTIGAKPTGPTMAIDDPKVCQRGMDTLLQALAQLRRDGVQGRPLIVPCGTTGASRFGRDYPITMTPMYRWVIKVPLADKVVMEDKLFSSGEDFTMVRASLLTNGESDARIRVGVEDPVKGRETEEIGFKISREDAGRWIAQNLVLAKENKYLNKIASITN